MLGHGRLCSTQSSLILILRLTEASKFGDSSPSSTSSNRCSSRLSSLFIDLGLHVDDIIIYLLSLTTGCRMSSHYSLYLSLKQLNVLFIWYSIWPNILIIILAIVIELIHGLSCTQSSCRHGLIRSLLLWEWCAKLSCKSILRWLWWECSIIKQS